MNTLLAASLATACLTAAAVSQSTGPGLDWVSSGGTAGSFRPSCVNLPTTTAQGDRVTVRVWGDPGSPFALAAAFRAVPCQPVPGIGNGLMLGTPLFVVGTGTLTQTTPCLSCPPSYEATTFTMPSFLPVGTAVSVQALAFGNNSPALTVAITVTVI